MVVKCLECGQWFEDVYRGTNCPHAAFPANDGENNFAVHGDAYLGSDEPPADVMFAEHFK